MPVLKPAGERWSVQRLYEDLHARILSGGLRPRALLSETKVADEYGLSRTPVRQVFHRLADAGLLSVVPQVGTYVAPIAVGAVRDAQFVRETLECRAVRHAALAANRDKEPVLRDHLDRQARAIAQHDHLGFFVADEAMHRALMEIAGHPYVWDLIVSAKVQLDRLRYLSLEAPDWLEMIFDQHVTLVDLVAAGDADAAAALMERHLRTAFAAIERIAAEHAGFFTEPGAAAPGRSAKAPATATALASPDEEE